MFLFSFDHPQVAISDRRAAGSLAGGFLKIAPSA